MNFALPTSQLPPDDGVWTLPPSTGVPRAARPRAADGPKVARRARRGDPRVHTQQPIPPTEVREPSTS